MVIPGIWNLSRHQILDILVMDIERKNYYTPQKGGIGNVVKQPKLQQAARLLNKSSHYMKPQPWGFFFQERGKEGFHPTDLFFPPLVFGLYFSSS